MKKTNRSRKAFTLIELIMVIAVIGLMSYIIMPKIIGNKQKSTISTVLQNDVSSIIDAAVTWRDQDPDSDGTWANLTATEKLKPYLPGNLVIDGSGSKSRIQSKTNPNIYYKALDAGSGIKIYVDMGDAKSKENWNDKFATYAENVFLKIAFKASTKPSETIKDGQATDIGNAGEASANENSADSDAKALVSKIAL